MKLVSVVEVYTTKFYHSSFQLKTLEKLISIETMYCNWSRILLGQYLLFSVFFRFYFVSARQYWTASCYYWNRLVETWTFLVCIWFSPNSPMEGDKGDIFIKAPDWKPLFLLKMKNKKKQAGYIRSIMWSSNILE